MRKNSLWVKYGIVALTVVVVCVIVRVAVLMINHYQLLN